MSVALLQEQQEQYTTTSRRARSSTPGSRRGGFFSPTTTHHQDTNTSTTNHHHPLNHRHHSKKNTTTISPRRASTPTASFARGRQFRQQQQRPSSSSFSSQQVRATPFSIPPPKPPRQQEQHGPKRIPFLESLCSVEVPKWLLREGVQVVLVSANGKPELRQLAISRDKFTVTLRSLSTHAPILTSTTTTELSLATDSVSSSGASSSSSSFAMGGGNSVMMMMNGYSPHGGGGGGHHDRSIDVGEMDRIQRGQSTQQFEKAKKRTMERIESNRRIHILSNDSGNSIEITPATQAGYSNSGSVGGMAVSSYGNASINPTTSAGVVSVAASAALSGVDTEINPSPSANLLHSLDPDRSFSIIFRGAQTLDLMALHRRARDEICDALDRILEAYARTKVRVAADVRLLRYVWLSVVDYSGTDATSTQQGNHGGGGGGSVLSGLGNSTTHAIFKTMARRVGASSGNSSSYEAPTTTRNDDPSGSHDDSTTGGGSIVNVGHVNFDQIARVVFAQINLYMKHKDVHTNYEKFGKVIGLDRKQRRRGLTFDQLADFLHYIRRNSWLVKPVNALWNELFGEVMNNGKKRETVSARTFLEKFLHAKQGQLDATLPHVHALFRRLHAMEISHNSTTTTATTTTTRPTTAEAYVSSALPSSLGSSSTPAESTSPTTTSDASSSSLPSTVVYNRITKDQFEAYLLTAENDAFVPEKERLDLASMNKPLSEYFINSSHNTYLIGDQYTSHSRVEMYSNALYRGCRCLELDIWDGGKTPSPDNTPIPVVWHGHTMTSKIYFVDIIRTIKVFLNFHPDTFPIILSFENHCTLPYQKVMAKQLEKILGSALYIPTEASLRDGPLPSPAQLRGMVVIKGRRPTIEIEDDDATVVKADTETDYADSDDESDDEQQQQEQQHQQGNGGGTGTVGGTAASVSESLPSTTTVSTTTTATTTTAPLTNRRVKKARLRHGIAPELARLTLFHGTTFKKYWPDSMNAPHHHMHSFNENKVRSMLRAGQQVEDWVVYNQTHMSRTYPAGSRVDSSNYNPITAWSAGCQMVALNFQTPDALLRLNDGRFRENGNCGYVLKPSSLMVSKHQLRLAGVVPGRLTIQVLSGSCLPKPKGRRTGDIIDPYVRLSLFDVNADGKETIAEFSTPVVKLNGFSPIFVQRNAAAAAMQLEYGAAAPPDPLAFEFVVENEAAAILQVTVLDKKSGKKSPVGGGGGGTGEFVKGGGGVGGEFVASCSIPISCLRPGIRSVKLYDATNTRSGAFDFASVLLDIDVTHVIAEI